MAKTILKQAEMVENMNKNSSATNKLEEGIFSDIRYICKSCSLITESLQKGCDVIQMPNGDIIITEMRPVTFQYSWDAKKGKLIRSSNTSGSKRLRERSKSSEEGDFDNDDEAEEI